MTTISYTSRRIFPSIAAANLMRLEEEVRKLELSQSDGIHFDVMDGHYVPLLTIGIPFIEQMKKITSLLLDVHIMVSNPDDVFEDYLKAGADILTFHIEAARHAHRMCIKIKEVGKKCGVALNPATHWKDIEYLLSELDQVTVMAVNPGFSRQAHLPLVHQKIRELADYRAQHNLKFEIQVDGGVSHENVQLLSRLGANVFVAGGAIFNFSDYKAAIDKIKNA